MMIDEMKMNMDEKMDDDMMNENDVMKNEYGWKKYWNIKWKLNWNNEK